MTSSESICVSEENKIALIDRYNKHKKFNGRCIGRCLCVDNFGRSYCQKSLRIQLTELLTDVVDIRFANVEVAGMQWQWGWCCIEFSSVNAAISAMEMLDHLYIRMGEGSLSVLRPLLSHFPNWNTEMDTASFHSDTASMALHYGQPNTVDKESREFLRLDRIVQQTKDRIMGRMERDLKPILRRMKSTPSMQLPGSISVEPSMDIDMPCGVLLLKNVPLSVTDDRLFAFFECIDPHVAIFRIQNPVTQKPGCHVVVTLSSTEKARLICEDIDRHTLLCDGFRPIIARVAAGEYMGGFECVLDRAMISIGMDLRHCSPSTELVYFKEITNDEQRRATQMRSLLEAMQHSRSCCWKLSCDQQRALHHHIMKKVMDIDRRFQELEKAISEADGLCRKH